MNTQPCLPQDIIEVNRSKEYTLISTNLLESVLTDPRLNAQSAKLWQILFNYARYNPRFEVKLSYGYLAKKLRKSERTISRYVDILQETGYLIVKHNFDKNGGQRPSTLSVRVPEEAIEHTKKKKDRHNKNSFNNNETSIIEVTHCHSPSKLIDGKKPGDLREQQLSQNKSNVLCGTIQSHKRAPKENYLFNIEKDNDLNSSKQPDKNDRGWHDINVVHKDNNKKDINKNNNNNVVPFSQEQKPEIVIQEKIKILEQQLSAGLRQESIIKEPNLLYDQMKKNNRIKADLYLLKIELEKRYRALEDNIKESRSDLEVKTNPILMLNKAGERTLSTLTFKRLINSLKSYGYCGNSLNVLINEIVFEARFGSLIHCNKTKNRLSVENAINIALKLVREKRWSSPALFNFGIRT